MQKVTLQTRQNALCWNPMEPFHFTTASEDHDLYTFDMRKLDHAICVHKGHGPPARRPATATLASAAAAPRPSRGSHAAGPPRPRPRPSRLALRPTW